jgi:hypothetical protein
MSDDQNASLQDLQARGLIHQVTAVEALAGHLASGSRIFKRQNLPKNIKKTTT